jgi:TetR/AcrR family transcriptional regulator
MPDNPTPDAPPRRTGLTFDRGQTEKGREVIGTTKQPVDICLMVIRLPAMATGNDARSRILDAATRRLADHGYAGTSLKAVAEDVGIRAPSLLYHFPSKGALRDAVLEGLLSRWKDLVPAVLVAATTGRDRFDGALGLMIGFFAEEPRRARLLVRESLDRPDAVRALVTAHLSPWMPLLTEYIELGQREGRVHKDLDATAYVTEVVLLAVAHFAMGPIALSIGSATDHAWEARRSAELRRLCNAALYLPRPEADDSLNEEHQDG